MPDYDLNELTVGKVSVAQGSSDSVKNKNVVTDGSGNVTLEAKYSHPASKQCTHSHPTSDITGVSTVAIQVTFTDNSTTTLNLLQYTSGS